MFVSIMMLQNFVVLFMLRLHANTRHRLANKNVANYIVVRIKANSLLSQGINGGTTLADPTTGSLSRGKDGIASYATVEFRAS